MNACMPTMLDKPRLASTMPLWTLPVCLLGDDVMRFQLSVLPKASSSSLVLLAVLGVSCHQHVSNRLIDGTSVPTNASAVYL